MPNYFGQFPVKPACSGARGGFLGEAPQEDELQEGTRAALPWLRGAGGAGDSGFGDNAAPPASPGQL